MLEDGGLFKDFEGKEGNKKEERHKVEKEEVEVKISFKLNKRFIERAIFIVIILILLVLVFYNPFGKYMCKKYNGEESAPIVQIEEEGVQENKTEVQEVTPKKTETPTKKEETTDQQLSGKITFSIEDIQLDVNKTKVQSITVKIDNQKKIFTPSIFIYWYDDEDLAVSKKPRTVVNYTGAITTGTKVWKLDDELKARYLSPDDPSKEIFKVELYDAKDLVVPIDTKTKTIDTD